MRQQSFSTIKLGKYIANQGISSRRKAKQLIIDGQIQVNGKTIFDPAKQINPQLDGIFFQGKKIQPERFRYIMLNKPRGFLSTVTDTHKRRTVLHLVKVPERIYPVGRLDKDSEGLILLTNDGELANRFTHPKFHVPKIYEVTVKGKVGAKDLLPLQTGIELEDGLTQPTKLTIIETPRLSACSPLVKGSKKIPFFKGDRQAQRRLGDLSTFHITLYEGRKRQIRRMCAALHLFITQLKRISIGKLQLGELQTGKWKELTKEEVTLLKS